MTADNIRFNPYDVVVVPFPYADRLAEKRRPALVISNHRLAAHGLIWVAMITSAENESWPTDVAIAETPDEAGLFRRLRQELGGFPSLGSSRI